MEDQIRRLESELRAYKTYWWVFLFVPGMYAILTYALGINVEASGGGGSALDMQLETILVLIIICDALVIFVFSLKFPSEGRLKKILLRKEQGQPRTCGLMLGAVFCESISVGGLLLGFLGVSHQSQIMTTLGYGLIFSGAIAIVFHRWRATKLLTRVLRELPTRMGKRIYLPPMALLLIYTFNSSIFFTQVGQLIRW